MRCPFCSHDETSVKDSRITEDASAIRRRRQCTSCQGRFTTFERVQIRELNVVKNNGDVRPFNRDKLLKSISLACRKRPIENEQIEVLANKMVKTLEGGGESSISSKEIGDLVLAALRKLDLVAFTRYASVYSRFEKTEDFIQFISKISEGK